MSEIKVDTLTGKTSANSITITAGASQTMDLIPSVVKIYVNFNGSSNTVLDSIGTSSVSDDYAGQYTYSFSNNMSSSSYGFSNTAGGNGGSAGDDSYGSTGQAGGSGGTLSSSFKGRYKHHTGTNYDASNASVLVVGDLA
jgi:hypothetical protein